MGITLTEMSKSSSFDHSEPTEEQKQAGRESMAKCLEDMARDIRSGELEVTHVDQDLPLQCFWANGRWNYFRLADYSLKMTYRYPSRIEEENKRLGEYLLENPQAQFQGLSEPATDYKTKG